MGKKLNMLSNVAANIYAITHVMFAPMERPEWLKKYEQNEWAIKRKTGLTDRQLKDIFNVLIEYDVIQNEGKRI